MPASGSRFEFLEWSRHMGPAQTPHCPAEWGRSSSLRMHSRGRLLEQHGKWRVSLCVCVEELCRTGKGIEEPALGPAKVSRGQGQPAETQRSDVIGKCSNQGSRRVSTYPFTPGAPPPASSGLGSLCCHGLQAPLLCDSLPPGSR